MLATLSQRRAISTLQGPTEVLVRFDGATMGGALRRDGQSRRYDAGMSQGHSVQSGETRMFPAQRDH
jgi:hypothetical protein